MPVRLRPAASRLADATSRTGQGQGQGQKSIPAPAAPTPPARLREPAVRRSQQLELPELDAGDAAAPITELRGQPERGRGPGRRRSPVAQPPLEDLLEEARSSSRLEGFARRMWAALRLMVLTVTLGLALSAAVGAGVFGLYRLVLAAR